VNGKGALHMGQPIGLVLAGGRGRRIGSAKGELIVGGQALALRAALALRPVCRSVLISIRPGARNPAPGFAAVEDLPPEGRGPLAGIDAAFRAIAAGSDLLVLACDYPRIDRAFLRRLVAAASEPAELVVLRDGGGRLHPLVGLWRWPMAQRVTAALDERRYQVGALAVEGRLRFLTASDFPGVDLDRLLLNLNSPEELESLEAEWRRSSAATRSVSDGGEPNG
jgi:molybdopterin-guanine dinucleotide biosynthesis protein A